MDEGVDEGVDETTGNVWRDYQDKAERIGGPPRYLSPVSSITVLSALKSLGRGWV